MNGKRLSFSQARGNLTSILDRVEKTGEPVTILRRGKPSAVIVSHDMFEQQIQKPKERRWKLAGSIKLNADVDVDAAIEKGRATISRALKQRTKRP
jgi:prevent-host-death family protein